MNIQSGCSFYGQDIGVPVGMEIIGRPFSEPTLIEIAYSFEQASHLRRPPVSAPEL